MLLTVGLYHLISHSGSWMPGSGGAQYGQGDRYMRENIDAMAKKVGEMQAKMMQLDALGERVASLAGVNPTELKTTAGSGGPLVADRSFSANELQTMLNTMAQQTGPHEDWLTMVESRLLEAKFHKMLIPTQRPLTGGRLGSHFGWRVDPITGGRAMHAGLDFAAPQGTDIYAAAGGVVVTREVHGGYGNLVEVDHGNGLVTRYAHTSKQFVDKGDLVKSGQKIAEVGTTGRSTGPHLHFEVLVNGVQVDPQKFLEAGENLPNVAALKEDVADKVAAKKAAEASASKVAQSQK